MNDELRFQELLDRWIKGNITLSDERELLALSRDDDFRKEALEGLLSTPAEPHATILASLKNKIQAQNSKKTRRFPLPFLLSMAAIGITILAAVWFFTRKQSDNQDLRAQNLEQPTPTPQRLDSSSTAKSDEIANVESGKRNNSIASAPAARNTYATKKDQPGSQEELESSSDIVAAGTKNSSPASGKAYTEVPGMIQDKMRAEASKPAPSSPAQSLETNGALAKESSKKMSDSISELKNTKADPFNNDWLNYLRRNARLTEEARNHNITGNVRLQFTINDAGKAENILVLKGLGYGCDEIAQKLLKDWTFPSGTHGAVRVQEISFVR